MYLKLTTFGSRENIYVNVDHIQTFMKDAGVGSKIRMISGNTVEVIESDELIIKMLGSNYSSWAK